MESLPPPPPQKHPLASRHKSSHRNLFGKLVKSQPFVFVGSVTRTLLERCIGGTCGNIIGAAGIIPELPSQRWNTGSNGTWRLHIHCVEYRDPGFVDSQTLPFVQRWRCLYGSSQATVAQPSFISYENLTSNTLCAP